MWRSKMRSKTAIATLFLSLPTPAAFAQITELPEIVIYANQAPTEAGKVGSAMTILRGDTLVTQGHSETANGKVRYISRSASATTRTYRVDIEAANPENKIPDGITEGAEALFGFIAGYRQSARAAQCAERSLRLCRRACTRH
jgi:multidrug efflux pump subunit AcrA (membrane-fusion protein)